MRAVLKSGGLVAVLKVAGCECFWVGARAGSARQHTAVGQPTMSFVDADKVKGVAGSRGLFRPSSSRLAAAAGAGSASTIPSSSTATPAAPSLEFSSEAAYHDHLRGQGKLPLGFRVGTDGLRFVPAEVPTEVTMNVTAIVLDEPSDRWAAVFTRNMFPGAPVIVGKERLAAEGRAIQAIVVNNKISNVCPGGDSKRAGVAGNSGGASAGVADSESICDRMAEQFGLEGGAGAVIPCSTGVIGWRLPVDAICDQLAPLETKMQSDSMFPASKSIMTTDRYPKMRGTEVGSSGGRLVGIAKGAGMIEPDMATMLVYLVTDLQIPREKMRELLSKKADASFNCISIDSDTSTSDTVLLVSSGKVPLKEGDLEDFEDKLGALCDGLAEDVVRNGEGTAHVMQVSVTGAPSPQLARHLGKAVVNSPLFKAAVAGNDPNVGRLLAVVGRVMGRESPETDVTQTRISLGGHVVFENNTFAISPEMEIELTELFKRAEMTTADGKHLPYPPHFRVVPIEIDLGVGDGSSTVLGSDLTAEYVHINGDYRS